MATTKFFQQFESPEPFPVAITHNKRNTVLGAAFYYPPNHFQADRIDLSPRLIHQGPYSGVVWVRGSDDQNWLVYCARGHAVNSVPYARWDVQIKHLSLAARELQSIYPDWVRFIVHHHDHYAHESIPK